MSNWTKNAPPGIKSRALSFSAWVATSRPGLLRPVVAGCAFGAYADSSLVAVGTIAALSYLGSAIAATGAAARADKVDNTPT
jgi:hypothetical protein